MTPVAPAGPVAPRRASPQGLRRRLLAGIAVPLLLIMLVSFVIDLGTAAGVSDEVFDKVLTDDLYDLESHIAGAPGRAAADLDAEMGAEIDAMARSSLPDTVYVAVRDGTGRVRWGDARLLAGAPAARPPRPDETPAFTAGVVDGRAVRIATHAVRLGGSDYEFKVAETGLQRGQHDRRLLKTIVAPNLAVILAVVLVVWLGVRRGLRPLQQVESEIASRSAIDLRPVDRATVPDEVRPMIDRLNELFGMVDTASRTQQRFIADAAHQLKTPLAVLRSQLDLADAEGTFDANPERRARMESAAARLENLVDKLLVDVRTEAPDLHAERERLDLAGVAEESASEYLDAALARDLDLGFELRPARVEGVRWMLREALGNLIDNAIHYTPPGGVITVRCGVEDGRPFLEVQDDGPGVPAAERERLFERFFRLPGSPGDGCGLGLPIVREIARAHRAEVELHDAEGGGLRVRIQFAA